VESRSYQGRKGYAVPDATHSVDAADLNNDGVLSSSEIGNAKDKVPAGIAGRDRVTRTNFMAGCTNSIS
jgi:hypothetical protein